MSIDVTIQQKSSTLAPSAVNTVALIGYFNPASGYAANTVYAVESPGNAAACGDGPGVMCAAMVTRASGRKCLLISPTTSGGACGAVTETPSGTGPTITLSGTPYYKLGRVAVKIVTAGLPGVGQFKIAKDGYTYGEILDIPAEPKATLVGTIDLSTITLSTLNGTTLIVTASVGGAQTITFTTPADVAAVAVQANTQTTNMTWSIRQGKYLVVEDDVPGATSSLSVDASSTGDLLVGITGTAAGAASTYLIPNLGVTVTFPASSAYVLDTIYSFATTCPVPSTANVDTAVDALRNSGYKFAQIFNLFDGVDSYDTLAHADALKAKLDGLEGYGIYALGNAGAPYSDSDATVKAAFVANTYTKGQVTIYAGDIYVDGGGSDTGMPGKYRVSSAWYAAAWKAKYRYSSNAANGQYPPIDGFYILSPDGSTYVRDETTATTKLRDFRFSVLETRPTEPTGPWFARDISRASAISLFRHPNLGAVVRRAVTVALTVLATFDNDDPPTNADGTITEARARIMEGAIGAPLRTDLLDPVPAHASSVTVQVDRAHDVTSDDNLPITVSVQSKGQIETISLTVNLTDKSITIN
jgi:hypothetical protein